MNLRAKKKTAFVNGALDQESCNPALLHLPQMQHWLTFDRLLWYKLLGLPIGAPGCEA